MAAVSLLRGWNQVGPTCPGLHLTFPLELQREGMRGFRPVSLCVLGQVMAPLCASISTWVEHV